MNEDIKMAGYIFLLDEENALEECVKRGVYSTRLPHPNGYWKTFHEATFADYITMRAGDNIYFFINRKIYGIGELVNIQWHGVDDIDWEDCKFSNYPRAYEPIPQIYEEHREKLLYDIGVDSVNCRWICTFKPQPHFFKSGIDMDELLSSNPNAFKMLRVMQGVSFIKFDDAENQAFKDALLKINQEALQNPIVGDNVFADDHRAVHESIGSRLSAKYVLETQPLLDRCCEGDAIRHEMAIEIGLLYQLTTKDKETIDIFGKWDYLSHQVVASPFKPIIYMDKMDLFGYSYIVGHAPTRAEYLVGEIKKGAVNTGDVDQLMKYVDWVQEEYCFNDYSMIKAFLVAHVFGDDVIAHKKERAIRMYTVGTRPARSLRWAKMRLVKYAYNESSGKLDFQVMG